MRCLVAGPPRVARFNRVSRSLRWTFCLGPSDDPLLTKEPRVEGPPLFDLNRLDGPREGLAGSQSHTAWELQQFNC